MAYTEHLTIKPEKIAATAVGAIYDELLLPNLFTPASFDEYKGAKNDTVNVKIPGLLPARSYAFRNDREKGIEFDEYTETTVPVSFTAGRLYSAVRLTDEQNDFDQITVNDLMPKQALAVARGMEHDAALTAASGDFEVIVGNAERDLYRSLIEARRLLRKFRAQGAQTLIVGTDFEAALLLEERFTRAVSSGNEAGAVLRSGNIGNWAGFNIYVSDLIPADEALAFVDSAFVTATAAPYVPNSVPFGASASADGYSLRWIRDYDSEHLVDRSVVDCYFGSKQVKDRGWVVNEIAATKPESAAGKGSTVNTKVWQEKILPGEYNVRSFKVKLGAASTSDVTGSASADFRSHLGLPANGIVDVPAKPKNKPAAGGE